MCDSSAKESPLLDVTDSLIEEVQKLKSSLQKDESEQNIIKHTAIIIETVLQIEEWLDLQGRETKTKQSTTHD